MFCSGVVRRPHLLLSSPTVQRTQIWLLAQGGGKAFLVSLFLKALLSPAFVTMLFPMISPARNPVPGSAMTWGHRHQPDSNTAGRGQFREPQVGILPVEGEPFATICNLFSKVYFVTIYLSFKKRKIAPPEKKRIFKVSGWCDPI